MDKIKPTDCYIKTHRNERLEYVLTPLVQVNFLEKKENMIVLTKEQARTMLRNAMLAQHTSSLDNRTWSETSYEREEYIKSLIP